MSAGYQDLSIEASGLAVRVRFDLENRGHRPWQAAHGLCVGWQLFDPATEAFLEEGDWLPVGADIQPHAQRPVSLALELPPQPGPYRLYISPRTDPGGWFYEAEWPFVVIDARVENGVAAIERAEVTTLGQLRRRGLGSRLLAAVREPLGTVWRHRRLIRSLVRREITARYRGSFGDVLWTLLHPLLLMLTYWFVFGVVLQARFGADPSRSGFVLYFLAGMLPWLAFSEAAARAPSVVVDNRTFVKKLVFPLEVLPVTQALAGLLTEAFALIIFAVFLIATRGSLPFTALWLPALAVPQLLFTIGAGWFLAALGVYLRDLGQVIGFALTLLFFLTPICYPETALPRGAAALMAWNPLYALVAGYRAVLLESRAPDWLPLAGLWGGGSVAFLGGYAWFKRLRAMFADVI